MRFQAFALAAAAILGQASACVGHIPRQDNSTGGDGFPKITRGVDRFDVDPATTGYFLSHFSLNVKNLTAMVDFYSNVFGMRHLFTFQMTENFSFTYLAHAAGGSNSSGFQTVDEMIREKNHRPGRLEMQFHNDERAISALKASTELPNTFSHIGIIVPDLAAALTRFEALGVNVVSRPGDIPAAKSALTNAMGAGAFEAEDPEAAALIAVFAEVNKGLVFVQDPDGNLIEVLPRDEAIAF